MIRQFLNLCSWGLLAVTVSSSCNGRIKADVVVYNTVIYTVDSGFSTAGGMAVKDGVVIATGKSADIKARYEAPDMVDAGGMAVYPGFVDAHAHFMGYGRSLYEVNLYDCKSWDEALQRIQTFVAAHPDELWIRGRGWDQNKFPGGQYPNNAKLEELFPGKLILLQRIDGHAAIASAKALEIAGVVAGTQLIGGTVEVKDGKPTGLLIDNAVDLVSGKIPQPGITGYRKWLRTADSMCHALGLTTVADCGLSWRDIGILDTLQRDGDVHMRVYAMLSDDGHSYDDYMTWRADRLKTGGADWAKCFPGNGPYKTEQLYVRSVKAYADGALGSRGACLLKHYSDQPGWGGFLLGTPAHFDSLAQKLIPTDFQLCTHAIGDSGNRVVLDIYALTLKGKNDRRWRIEHAQVVDPADFDKFGTYSIVPSVQPTHATSDMYWAKDRLGPDRIKSAYAYNRLLHQNGWLPLGTDFPVEDISPFRTFLAAVARVDATGFPEGGFQPENALTREQAIRGMTIWAAKGCFMEQEIGSLEVGKKADFILLDKDLMKVAYRDILKTNVLHTYVGGKKVK